MTNKQSWPDMSRPGYPPEPGESESESQCKCLRNLQSLSYTPIQVHQLDIETQNKLLAQGAAQIIYDQQIEIQRLRQQLATARADALKEAAAVCRQLYLTCEPEAEVDMDQAVDAIEALAGKETGHE